MLTSAGFNRRMRKTACPVVWKGCGVQLPSAPSNPFGKGHVARSAIYRKLWRCHGLEVTTLTRKVAYTGSQACHFLI